jgi:hypothetical protein
MACTERHSARDDVLFLTPEYAALGPWENVEIESKMKRDLELAVPRQNPPTARW